jgi:hypothetical protein
MSASTSRSAACLAVTVLLVGLAGGCGGDDTASSAPSAATTTSTTAAPTATPTTVPPMTAEELAWLKLIPTVSKKIDKTVETTSNLTTRGMTKLATSLRSCTRQLARGGSPSDRLQPVYVLVKKGCKEYDKGAVCFTTAARIGIPLAGSAEERKQTDAIDCGFAAVGKGGIYLADAENKGAEIKDAAGS